MYSCKSWGSWIFCPLANIFISQREFHIERKLGKKSFYYASTSLVMCLIDPCCMSLEVEMFVFLERPTGVVSSLSGKEKNQFFKRSNRFSVFLCCPAQDPSVGEQWWPRGCWFCFPPLCHGLQESANNGRQKWGSPNAWCAGAVGPQHLGTTRNCLWMTSFYITSVAWPSVGILPWPPGAEGRKLLDIGNVPVMALR